MCQCQSLRKELECFDVAAMDHSIGGFSCPCITELLAKSVKKMAIAAYEALLSILGKCTNESTDHSVTVT